MESGFLTAKKVVHSTWRGGLQKKLRLRIIKPIFLISQDGKILAMDLRDGKIKEAVASALAN